MIVKSSHATAVYIVLMVLCVASIAYCASRAGEDILFLDWLATASRTQVWLFSCTVVAVGVSFGRMWSK